MWLVHGYPGLLKFRSSRNWALAQDPDIKDSDWFHNGRGEVLPVVLETIDGLHLDLRVSDPVTERILEELVKRMLDISDARPSARQLYMYATRICRGASNSGSAQPPPPPSAGLPTPTVEIALNSAPYVSSSGPSLQPPNLPINRPSPSQHGNPGSTRIQLPNLRVDVAEKFISERKAGRFTASPNDNLLRRLENRDHVGICSN